jgi:hypothetical protein
MPDERAVAQLLDDAFTRQHHWHSIEDDDSPEAEAALARLHQAEDKLIDLEATSPATWLAKLCYGCLYHDEVMFAAAGAPRFDFAAVATVKTLGDRQRQLFAQVVVALEAACAGGPVAGVIARHREISRDGVEDVAAELLDQALQARWDFCEAGLSADDPVSERQTKEPIQRREDEAAARLLALSGDCPAVELAQVAYQAITTTDTRTFSEEFEFGEAMIRDHPLNRVAADLIRQRLKACVDSPVVAVIEKHRRLAKEWDARTAAIQAAE